MSLNNKCDNCGKPAYLYTCVECCDHMEHDHGICMDCGEDITDDLVGKAEDAADAAREREWEESSG